MKLHTETHEVLRDGNVGEQLFTIKATGKAFDILSSGLYSDKILAIIRELSCNAYDAHVASGKADVPIEIKLPNTLDPVFYVKDYGTGLSHEQVCTLYTTYFDSTKQDSNEFIGALGLGSKSPFSYVSTFNVESRFNGVKRVYTCFKNEAGLPSITLMSEEFTDESSGMTVMLSVKHVDTSKFYSAARKALMYFNPTPKMVGYPNFTPYNLKHTVTGTNWRIRENEFVAYMSGPYVVQGFVAYPIDGFILKEHGLSQTAAALTSVAIDFDVNIGDVEVAASREALSYDTRTIKNLTDIFERAASEMRVSFQNSFDKCKTEWEVGLLIDEFEHSSSNEFRQIYNALRHDKPFTWNGKEVDSTIRANVSNLRTTTLTMYNLVKRNTKVSASRSWTPTEFSQVFDIVVQKNLHILVDTEAKGNTYVYRTYLQSLGNEHHLLVIRPTSKHAFNQHEIDQFIQSIGNPEYKMASELGIALPKRTSYSYQKKDKSVRMCWVGYTSKIGRGGYRHTHRVFSRLCWHNETIDMTEGGFYVPVERFSIVHNNQAFEPFDTLLEYAKSLDLFDNNTNKVYGFTEKEINSLDDDSEWVNLFEYLKIQFEFANNNGQLFGRSVVDNMCEKIGRDFTRQFVQKWSMFESAISAGEFKTYISKLVNLNRTTHEYDKHHIDGFIALMNISNTASTMLPTLTQEWKDIVTKYEMLSLSDLYNLSDEGTHVLIRYINLIEQQMNS